MLNFICEYFNGVNYKIYNQKIIEEKLTFSSYWMVRILNFMKQRFNHDFLLNKDVKTWVQYKKGIKTH